MFPELDGIKLKKDGPPLLTRPLRLSRQGPEQAKKIINEALGGTGVKFKTKNIDLPPPDPVPEDPVSPILVKKRGRKNTRLPRKRTFQTSQEYDSGTEDEFFNDDDDLAMNLDSLANVSDTEQPYEPPIESVKTTRIDKPRPQIPISETSEPKPARKQRRVRKPKLPIDSDNESVMSTGSEMSGMSQMSGFYESDESEHSDREVERRLSPSEEKFQKQIAMDKVYEMESYGHKFDKRWLNSATSEEIFREISRRKKFARKQRMIKYGKRGLVVSALGIETFYEATRRAFDTSKQFPDGSEWAKSWATEVHEVHEDLSDLIDLWFDTEQGGHPLVNIVAVMTSSFANYLMMKKFAEFGPLGTQLMDVIKQQPDVAKEVGSELAQEAVKEAKSKGENPIESVMRQVGAGLSQGGVPVGQIQSLLAPMAQQFATNMVNNLPKDSGVAKTFDALNQIPDMPPPPPVTGPTFQMSTRLPEHKIKTAPPPEQQTHHTFIPPPKPTEPPVRPPVPGPSTAPPEELYQRGQLARPTELLPPTPPDSPPPIPKQLSVSKKRRK